MNSQQRAFVGRQILSSPHAQEALIGGLQARRAAAIEDVLKQTDHALTERAKGRVLMLDEIIEEYNTWLMA